MKKNNLSLAMNPFERIAGGRALFWGVLGMCVSTLLSYLSGWHYHGLLHFGPASNSALWCYLVEHILVWFIPSVLFYVGGRLLSKSRIRVIDVLGTVSFAQLPLIIMNLFYFLPPMQLLTSMSESTGPVQLLQQPGFMLGLWLSLLSSVFLLWALVWMCSALRVSCNLKGVKLAIVFGVSVILGDILCRSLIAPCY